MTSLKLGYLNLTLHLHIGILAHNMFGEGLVACPRPPPPTFTFNDCITHKHQQHALNAFVLDLVKSCDSCNNNNNNNNNNIHSMTSLTLPSMTLTLHLMILTLHLMTLTSLES